jgi:hypothetical protein
MGRGHPHDLRWPTEECADDAKTQGKRSARKCRLATREESPNGGAKWRLAGGERRGVSSRHWRESDGKRKLQSVLPFLYEKKREREGAVPVPHVGDGQPMAHRSDGNTAQRPLPCPDRTRARRG